MNSKGEFKCIAVDMGASSIRIMLGTLREGTMRYHEYHRFENRVFEKEGHERWDFDRITREVVRGINRIVDEHGHSLSSIGFDSWGVDFAMLDENGELIETPVSYRDARTLGMDRKWQGMMSKMETFERTGINFYQFNTLYQLLSIKETEALKNTNRILFTPGFMNYLLTGLMRNELTIASTSQLLSARSTSWDPKILEHLGLAPEIFGQPDFPGTILGEIIHPSVHNASMQVIQVCGHDTASAVLALPAGERSAAYISSGTWCIVGVESESPILTKEALKAGFTNERGFNNTFRILKNIVGLWLIQGLKKELPDTLSHAGLERIADEAGSIPQVINPDSGVFYNPVNMKAAFDAYFRETGQNLPRNLSGYIKCAYDSLCFSFRYHIELLEELTGKHIGVLHLIGGGSQSDYLNQNVADVSSRPVISGPVEGAAIGNILVQALSLGIVEDRYEIRQIVKRSFDIKEYAPQSVHPDMELRYEQFKHLITLNHNGKE
ncbi:MAG: rhamnulokinase [Bacteroidales bacterium]|nr:rhamnulokinase [Bacteroidales bacterium]MBN2697251.1 rhamnulokinase [Bacteroidales bacterium]